MSQVRKLQAGSTVPRRGKLTIGANTYDLNDEKTWQALNSYLENGRQYGMYTKDILNALASGQDIRGDVLDNRIYGLEGFSSLSNRDNNKLKRAHGSTWDAIVNNGPQQARDAIAYFLGFNYTTPEAEAAKRVITNKSANFDYDTVDGKQVFSSNPKNIWIKNRFNDYLDWLSDPNWDDSKVTWEGSRNEPILKAWYSQYENRDQARAAIDAALQEVESKPWEEVSEATKELLAYFNIGNAGSSASSNTPSAQASGQRPVAADGSIDHSARTDNGAYRTWLGNADNGEVAGKLYTNSTLGDNRPYLLNKDRLAGFGLGDDYLNGVVYNGRIFKPGEVGEDVTLNDIMQRVITANNTGGTPSELHSVLNGLINYTDYDPSLYTYYNPEEHYWDNAAVRRELGETGRYGIADASNAYDGLNGGHIYEIYDYGNNGDQQWGFRSPFYLITDKDGNLTSVNGNPRYDTIPSEYAFLNRNYGSGPQFSNWVDVNGTLYGLNRSVWGSDAHNTNPYDIYEGRDGKFYHKKGNGEFVVLDDDLVDAIFNKGLKPSRRQMDNGTLSGKTKKNTYDPNRPIMPPAFQHGPMYRKEGGKVQLKPLPAKYQMGSRLLVEAPQSVQSVTPVESPLKQSGNLWESLTSADKKEITAAAIDVAGAIAGLVPGGSIAGAVSGIGASTPLFLSAAKDRKGHLDAGDWGQAALATGLDLVSLIPYLGETGKLVKVGKAISKVAVPLGKAFGALGLVEAASALTKNPKDWDTNDLLKLSAGIQSVINIGHNAHLSRGDSRLASEISKIRGEGAPKDIVYQSKTKYTIGETKDVLKPLEAGEIDSILSSKTPGQQLKDVLKARGVKEEELGNSADLLREWGFQVDQKGKITRLLDRKGEGIRVAAQTPQEEPTFSKYGYLADPLRVFGNPELKRRAYIDSNLDAVKNDPRIQRLLFNRGEVVNTVRTPREEITEYKRTPKTGFLDGAEARAYLRSLARTGSDKVTTSWTSHVKSNGDDGTVTTVLRQPTPEFVAEEAGRRLASETPSDMIRSMREDAMKLYNMPGTQEERVASALSKVIPSAESKALGRSANLGASGMSNKDILAHLNDKDVPFSEAVEFLASLPERKRASVLNAIAEKGAGIRAKQARSAFLKTNALDDAMSKLPDVVARTFTGVDARTANAKKAFAESRRIADNLDKIRNSKDPMQTLRQLSEQEGFANGANDNAEQFREALNEALRGTVYERLTGQRLDRYLYKLQNQMKNNGLVFKKGGTLKAQYGLGLPEFKLPEFKPIRFGNSYTGFNPNTNQVFSQWDTTKNSGPLFNINVGSTGSSVASNPSTTAVASDGNGLGGPSKNARSYFKYIDPALGLYDYISTLRSDKKYTDQMIRALNEGRVSRVVTPFKHVAEVTPEVDRAMADVRARTMMGIKPVTSDIVTHNAAVNQLQSQAIDQLNALMGQKSQQMATLRAQNQQIDNTNTERFDQVANENRIANASIDSAIEQQRAAEIMRRGQSRSNYIKEIRSLLAKDKNTILQQSYNDKLRSEQAAYDTGLDKMVGDPSIREKWNNLGTTGQANYTDYTDYLAKEYADRFAAEKWGSQIDKLNKQMTDNLLQWKYDNILNFDYPDFITGRQYLAGRSFKKGGTLRGNTRYKLEPDEQIWVNQNKAVHAAVAKLNDNTIKLLLRSLK